MPAPSSRSSRVQKRSKRSSRWVSYGFLLVNTVVWGAALIIVKPSLEVTTPFRYLLYRYLFASFLAIPFICYYWKSIRNKAKTISTIFAIEFLGTGLALALLYFGLKFTTGIEASLLTTTQPVFIVIGGLVLLREKEEQHELLGLLIALAGTILLTSAPILANGGFHLGNASFLGALLVLGSIFVNMIYFPLTKKYYRELPKLFASSISFYFGLIFFFLASLAELNFDWIQLSQAVSIDSQSIWVWIAALYMAIFGSIIGFTAYIKGQDGIEASEASLFGYLQPLVSIPLGIWLLKESVSSVQILALIIVLLGVIIAERRVKKRRHH